jgi:hypothetical protein
MGATKRLACTHWVKVPANGAANRSRGQPAPDKTEPAVAVCGLKQFSMALVGRAGSCEVAAGAEVGGGVLFGDGADGVGDGRQESVIGTSSDLPKREGDASGGSAAKESGAARVHIARRRLGECTRDAWR